VADIFVSRHDQRKTIGSSSDALSGKMVTKTVKAGFVVYGCHNFATTGKVYLVKAIQS